jgi:hypothetical protein
VKRAKCYYTYPEFVFIGRQNVSVVQVVALSAAKDAKKAFVVSRSEIDKLWGNALDTHNVEEKEDRKLEWEETRTTLWRAGTAG